MNGLKILRTDSELETPHLDRMLRQTGAELVLLPDGIPESDFIAAAGEADLVLMCYTPVTERVIAAAPRLKGIVKYGVGIDAIDIAAAKKRGIPVVNIPEYAEETVAEGAFALMIALAKRLIPIHQAVQEGGWLWPQSAWLASDLASKTIGLIGCGRIGRSFARMAGDGFRMKVLAHDPHVPEAQMESLGITPCRDLHAMLGECDFVSIHSVLNDETHHLLDAAALAAMKPGAILINVSRGAIVDEMALVAAIRNGHLGGAALDVYSQEPLSRSAHPLADLYGRDNVILFPHLTFFTAEAMQRLEEDTLARCREIAEGRPVTIRSSDPRLAGQQNCIYPAAG